MNHETRFDPITRECGCVEVGRKAARHHICSGIGYPCLTAEAPMMTTEQSTVQDWIRLIQAEYLEMPGLHLTKPQVRRLWRLEPQMCDVLLDSLVATEFLKKTHRDAYALAQAPV